MWFKHKGIEYELTFKYGEYTDTKINKIGSTIEVATTTTYKRVMASLQSRNFLAAGISRCSPLDNFSKEIGRELALERLMKNISSKLAKQVLINYVNR